MLNQTNQASELHKQIASNRTENLSGRLRVVELFATLIGFLVVLTHAGFITVGESRVPALDAIVLLAMSSLTLSRFIRFAINWNQRGVIEQIISGRLLVPCIWLCGLVLIF